MKNRKLIITLRNGTEHEFTDIPGGFVEVCDGLVMVKSGDGETLALFLQDIFSHWVLIYA